MLDYGKYITEVDGYQGNGNGYDQLEGEWAEWLEVAQKYEHKVKAQDRLDIRHDILLELAKARARDGKPLPVLRAYRIASLTVAFYWRQRLKLNTGLDCGHCSKANRARCKRDYLYSQCPKLVKVVSLEQSSVYLETVADDKALDLDIWLDSRTWLLGCPMRLIEVAYKRLKGMPLSGADRKYLWKHRKKAQKSLF